MLKIRDINVDKRKFNGMDVKHVDFLGISIDDEYFAGEEYHAFRAAYYGQFLLTCLSEVGRMHNNISAGCSNMYTVENFHKLRNAMAAYRHWTEHRSRYTGQHLESGLAKFMERLPWESLISYEKGHDNFPHEWHIIHMQLAEVLDNATYQMQCGERSAEDDALSIYRQLTRKILTCSQGVHDIPAIKEHSWSDCPHLLRSRDTYRQGLDIREHGYAKETSGMERAKTRVGHYKIIREQDEHRKRGREVYERRLNSR